MLHYAISLDISSIGSNSISGCTTVKLRSESNGIQQVELSLLALNIDSITFGQSSVSYSYNDTTLTITLPQPVSSSDSVEIEICYHGNPVMDASGWGGFYFSGNYAFNLGVGFDANPHNYGRVWFPCVDNFTDRATYEFLITTNAAHKAFCNGRLIGSTINPIGTVTWHWSMDQTIPTYLASVAVSAYQTLEDKYPSISGDSVPVMIAAQAGDTTKLKASFIHLPDAFTGFEECFGPHPFERIGFVLVPFSGGAMEHATNISYPRFAVNGGLEYETLMAHEFSHHWWGDLVTCASAEDMWLNEGWATYSESIFREKVYGQESYRKNVRANHKNVLQFTHIEDNGYRAVSGVPHAYTYGRTVYDKGAEVAHTLRGYLGDRLFFSCLASYLDAFKFSHATSFDFRDHLSQCSGMVLTSFFENWVFNPGFPHFSIDSFFITDALGSYDVTVFIRQRLKAAPSYYSGIPLELSFISKNFDSAARTVWFNGGCGIYHTTIGFEPAYIAVDINEKISDAVTDKLLHINTTGSYDFEEAMMAFDATMVPSEALIRVEHNWIAPDPIKTAIPGLHISKERYWKVDGILPNGFVANAKLSYDGTTSLSTGYLDNELITNSEDSLVILHRLDAKSDWSIHPSFIVNTQGSTGNKRGEITINDIWKGEYSLGIWDHSRPVIDSQVVNSPCFVLGEKDIYSQQGEVQFDVFPNPANDSFYIKFEKPMQHNAIITIIDMAGKLVDTMSIAMGSDKLNVSSSGWSKNVYLIKVEDSRGITMKRVVVLN